MNTPQTIDKPDQVSTDYLANLWSSGKTGSEVKCPYCDKTFEDEIQIQPHRREHYKQIKIIAADLSISDESDDDKQIEATTDQETLKGLCDKQHKEVADDRCLSDSNNDEHDDKQTEPTPDQMKLQDWDKPQNEDKKQDTEETTDREKFEEMYVGDEEKLENNAQKILKSDPKNLEGSKKHAENNKSVMTGVKRKTDDSTTASNMKSIKDSVHRKAGHSCCRKTIFSN